MNSQYTFASDDSVIQLGLYGPLSASEIGFLKVEIAYQFEEFPAPLVIDVSRMTSVDSITLGFFAWLHQYFEPTEYRVCFHGLQDRLQQIFETVGFLEHATVFDFYSEQPTKLPAQGCTKNSASLSKEEEESGREQNLVKAISKVFYPSPEQLGFMRSYLDDFLAEVDCDNETREDVRIACCEAFANAITHGSRGVLHAYSRVELKCYSNLMVIDVFDNGEPFLGDYEESRDVFRLHGRGVLLMKSLMDRVDFIPQLDDPVSSGTTVRLIKRLE